MSKAIIAVGLIFILIAAGIVFIYFKFESKDDNEVDSKVQFAIYSKNLENDLISTGYIIESSGIVLKNSTTLNGGAVLEKLPFNRSFKIYNYNLNNQKYYIDEVLSNSFDNVTHRIELDLIEGGSLETSYTGEVAEDNEITLILKSSGEYRNIHFCLKWSPYILSVKSDFDISETRQGYAKCYFTNTTLKDDKIIIPLKIVRYGELLRDDYIDVLVYDADYLKGEYVFDNVGAQDYQIKVINNIFKH